VYYIFSIAVVFFLDVVSIEVDIDTLLLVLFAVLIFTALVFLIPVHVGNNIFVINIVYSGSNTSDALHQLELAATSLNLILDDFESLLQTLSCSSLVKGNHFRFVLWWSDQLEN
jgi:hypothetical protein